LYATVRLGGDVMFFLFFLFFIESDKGVGQLDKGCKALIDDFFFFDFISAYGPGWTE
jgi:hypothetical protein